MSNHILETCDNTERVGLLLSKNVLPDLLREDELNIDCAAQPSTRIAALNIAAQLRRFIFEAQTGAWRKFDKKAEYRVCSRTIGGRVNRLTA